MARKKDIQEEEDLSIEFSTKLGGIKAIGLFLEVYEEDVGYEVIKRIGGLIYLLAYEIEDMVERSHKGEVTF